MNSDGLSASDLLAPLRALVKVREGAAAYYRQLISTEDEFIRVGAWLQLLSMDAIVEGDWAELVRLSRHASIRGVATEFFRFNYEHESARQAASAPAVEHEEIRRAGLLAKLEFNDGGVLRYCQQMYFASGDTRFLVEAAIAAEAIDGWSEAVPWLVRRLVLSPTDSGAGILLLLQIVQSERADLIEELLSALATSQLPPELHAFGLAALASSRAELAKCIELLAPLTDQHIQARPNLRPLLQSIKILRASSLDKLHAFEESYAEYSQLNAINRATHLKPQLYVDAIRTRARYTAPPLPPDPRSDVVQMLGFPRSGTTLLENALDAHHAVETFEEIPAHLAALAYLERTLVSGTAFLRSKQDIYYEARLRYYGEIDIRRRKPEAVVLIDKLPIQSADARFTSTLFPERRYIFSIRHPFDVVLSCFRQQFTPNLAMEHFRTIPDAIRFYDFTMTEWFGVFPLDSPNVSYVRYEALVGDFESTVRQIIGFLGLPWDSAILDFAERAKKRSLKTPSYQKVRQGLSIGVQTYWRNYGFLFQTPEAEPLHKWAKFFGYPTK